MPDRGVVEFEGNDRGEGIRINVSVSKNDSFGAARRAAGVVKVEHIVFIWRFVIDRITGSMGQKILIGPGDPWLVRCSVTDYVVFDCLCAWRTFSMIGL